MAGINYPIANNDEFNQHKEDYAQQVGTASNLTTTSKEVVGAVNELNDNKANKQQEAWITPTLLNRWISPTEIKYYKDDFGVVRISGRVSDGGGASGAVFQLPVGYRPSVSRQFPVISNNVFAAFMIEHNGNVIPISSNTKVNINLDAITFKAER